MEHSRFKVDRYGIHAYTYARMFAEIESPTIGIPSDNYVHSIFFTYARVVTRPTDVWRDRDRSLSSVLVRYVIFTRSHSAAALIIDRKKRDYCPRVRLWSIACNIYGQTVRGWTRSLPSYILEEDVGGIPAVVKIRNANCGETWRVLSAWGNTVNSTRRDRFCISRNKVFTL